MIGGSKVVKITAKTALNGKMLKAIFTTAFFLFCSFICQYSAGIFSYTGKYAVTIVILIAEYILLLAPIFLGYIRYIWRMIFGADDNPVSIFYYISSKELYLKAMKFLSALILKAVPAVVVLFLPSILLSVFTKEFFYDMLGIAMPLWVANFNSVITILTAVAIVGLCFYMLRYYISPILFIADEDMDIYETFHMSVTVARKSLLDFIYLFSSFIGWILLSILVIPLIFTLPYFITAYAVHTRFSVAEYNKVINQINSNEGNMYGA